MIHTYQEAVQYLYEKLPMFQRVGAAAYKKDLTNTLKLCAHLGDPQQKFKTIHVAGTNGKGSSSHMLASVLHEAGYRTALYTSPHLKSFRERIKINGQEIPEEFIIGFVNRIMPMIDELSPSFFEITVAMAFEYFAIAGADIAVIETGLGGRLDSTNVITPVVSLITNIGWDHKEILGDTLEKIAAEKAGIIKPGIPVVISERQPDLAHVFLDKAASCDSAIFFTSDLQVIPVKEGLDVLRDGRHYLQGLKLPLRGFYQRKNIGGVLKAIEVLNASGFDLNDRQIRAGLERVVENTGLKGRWQILRERPLMICDTAHNPDGLREVLSQIESIDFKNLHIVLGMVKDKDIAHSLSLFPRQANYYFCQAKIPRALDAEMLKQKANDAGLQGEVFRDVNEAKRMALEDASPDDLIFIGGSTFVVAELEEL